MMESKLKYPGEVYQPTWRFLRENFTERELTREYSRLRDIAQKRLGRMGETEFARSATYERNVGRFPKLSAFKSGGKIEKRAEFARRFAELARFVDSPISTTRGQREIRKKTIESLHEIGYTFVNTGNYWDFLDFMDDYRARKLDRIYDSDRVAQAYKSASKARVDPDVLLDDFEFWQSKTNQKALEEWRRETPNADVKAMGADELRAAVEQQKKRRKKASR